MHLFVKLVTSLYCFLVSFNYVYSSEVDLNEKRYDPCIAAMCIENSTCIAVPEPECLPVPLHGHCDLIAMCIPNTANSLQQPTGPVCGNQVCEINQQCAMVQVECFTTPCPPLLTCVNGGPPGHPYFATKGFFKKSALDALKENF